MNLLAMERIKLLTTRSPWWCAALVFAIGVGLAALIATVADTESNPISVGISVFGLALGSYIIMVLGAIAVTSEYRFGTIRATFAAVPNRAAVLVAKAVVVTLLAGLIGLVTAFASWGVAYLIDGTDAIAIDSGAEWRAVAGQGAIYAGYAFIAVGVGLLVRATAGAISLLLVWALLVETIIVPIIDGVAGTSISRWLPFANAQYFINAGDEVTGEGEPFPFGGPWGSFAYFLAVGLIVLVAGMVVAQRRDA